MNTPIKLGGFGMLDVSALDRSLKVRAIARMFDSRHPLLRKIAESFQLEDYFYPKIAIGIDDFSVKGIYELGVLRRLVIGKANFIGNRFYLSLLKSIKIINLLNQKGKISLSYFLIRNRGKIKVEDLTLPELNSIRNFIDPQIHAELIRTSRINVPQLNDDAYSYLINTKGNFVDLRKLNSKGIRLGLKSYEPISELKFGVTLTPSECLNWGYHLNKVQSVRHKSLLLRIAHGEFYTKEKLHRYGLIDSPNCQRCGRIENLAHKVYECEYASMVWSKTLNLTKTLRTSVALNETISQRILGATSCTTSILISVHAEILTRLLSIKDEQNFMIRPIKLLELSLETIKRNELRQDCKDKIDDLLLRLRH